MAQCPQCKGNVSYSAMLRAGGLAGIICPICKAELTPRVWTNAVAQTVAMLVGMAAAEALRSFGFGWLIRLVGMLIAYTLSFALVSWVGWDRVIRLRQRSDSSHPLGLDSNDPPVSSDNGSAGRP
jgi:hypothetical protein